MVMSRPDKTIFPCLPWLWLGPGGTKGLFPIRDPLKILFRHHFPFPNMLWSLPKDPLAGVCVLPQCYAQRFPVQLFSLLFLLLSKYYSIIILHSQIVSGRWSRVLWLRCVNHCCITLKCCPLIYVLPSYFSSQNISPLLFLVPK
jgi:hypothetical protein